MVYLSKIIKEAIKILNFSFSVIFRHQKTTKSVYKTLLANNIKATFIIETFCSAEIQILNGLYTLPTTEILSGKKAWAWVSMVLYFKKNK